MNKNKKFEEIMELIEHVSEIEIKCSQTSEELKKAKKKWLGKKGIINWIINRINRGHDQMFYAFDTLLLGKEVIDYELPIKISTTGYQKKFCFDKIHDHYEKHQHQKILPVFDYNEFYKIVKWESRELF